MSQSKNIAKGPSLHEAIDRHPAGISAMFA
jgi:hypothetical protein